MKRSSRNITYRLYPTKSQETILVHWLGLHCELYNAALQERRDAWQKCGISLTYNHQQNELPAVKQYRPDLTPLGSHALQETVRRVDRAYRGFFRRVKSGQISGFPRFKSRSRFDSFCYPDPAGWKVLGSRLKVTNLGSIPMRGKPRVSLEHGEVRTLTVRRKNGKWYATINVRYPDSALQRNQVYADRAVGLDAGCVSIVATSDGDIVESPKFLKQSSARLRSAQKELSRKKIGSRARERARRKVARLHGRIANQRKDFLHQLSSAVVALYSFIVMENLQLCNMTRSAKGTVDKPGRNVKQKAGLNRSLLDTSIGMLLSMLAYKAEEAGSRYESVAPGGTSQDCFWCGNTVTKTLSVRIHDCSHCGFVTDRDHNAALNILFRGLVQDGWEPSDAWSRVAAAVKRETATMTPMLLVA